MDNKPFPDVALTILKDAASIKTNLFYTDEYKNRYAISQVVDGKEHKNIEKNLEFFKALEKKQIT